MSALDYYNTLTSQGLRPYEAYNAVQASFGPPKTPRQQAEDAASAEQNAALAQTGGTIGGLLIGQEAMRGFPNIAGLFKSGVGSGVTEMPVALGGETALAEGSTLSSIGSVALPVAVGAAALSTAWETGMKDILRGRGTREDYINQGVNMATGFAPNLALKLMGKRSIGKMMTTGKSDSQLLRDDFRGLLKQTGVADDKYNVTLADGSTFNIGLDGKTKYENVGKNIDGKTTRNAWDVDFSNPLAKFATDQLDPKVRSIYQDVDGKVKPEQYTGMLVNAVTSNAKSEKDVLANINAMLGKSTFAQQQKPATPAAPTVSTRPPAPLPPSTPAVAVEKPAKKNSIRDILELNINK
jgi:hypothetical protein